MGADTESFSDIYDEASARFADLTKAELRAEIERLRDIIAKAGNTYTVKYHAQRYAAEDRYRKIVRHF